MERLWPSCKPLPHALEGSYPVRIPHKHLRLPTNVSGISAPQLRGQTICTTMSSSYALEKKKNYLWDEQLMADGIKENRKENRGEFLNSGWPPQVSSNLRHSVTLWTLQGWWQTDEGVGTVLGAVWEGVVWEVDSGKKESIGDLEL